MSDDDDAAPELGAKVASSRRERGMTQTQLAEALGIKQASLSMIETGELGISKDLRKRLAAWVESGGGPKEKAPRGPYKRGQGQTVSENEVVYKKRSTIG